MGVRFAKGTYAWGLCARSGRKMLLRDMVPDGYIPGLLVDPNWRDIAHPSEKPIDVSDAEALRRPAPDLDKNDSAGTGPMLRDVLTPTFGGNT